MVTFQETMIELLTGVAPPDKGKNVEFSAAKTSLVSLFEMLNIPENFHKMLRIAKARSLFYKFLKIESASMQVTRAIITEIFSGFVQKHREKRNFPAPLFHFLVQLMTGQNVNPPLTMVTDMQAIKQEVKEFSIQSLQECWLLSLVLKAIPACSDQLAIEVLRDLNHFFIMKNHMCRDILQISGYQMWFFPLLFDQYTKDESGDSPQLSSRSIEYFNLSFHMLCVLHVYSILDQTRPERPTEVLKAILRDEVT